MVSSFKYIEPAPEWSSRHTDSLHRPRISSTITFYVAICIILINMIKEYKEFAISNHALKERLSK